MARKEIQGRDKLFYAVLCESPDQWEDELNKLDHVDFWTFSPRTLLHTAVWAGRYEWVEMLLAKGADPTLKDERGMNALEVAQLLNTEKENDANRRLIVDIIALIMKVSIKEYGSNVREDEEGSERNTISPVEFLKLGDIIKRLELRLQISAEKVGNLHNSWKNLKTNLLRSSGVSCVSSNIMPDTNFNPIINEATITSKNTFIDNVSLDGNGIPLGKINPVEGEAVIAKLSHFHGKSLSIGKTAPDMMQPDNLNPCSNDYDTVENTSLEVSTMIPWEDIEPTGTTDVSICDSSVVSSNNPAGLKATAAEIKAGSSKSDEPDKSKVNRGIIKVAASRPSNTSVKTSIGRESFKEDEVDPPNEQESIADVQSPPLAKKVERVLNSSSVVSNCDPAGLKLSSFTKSSLKATVAELKAGSRKSDKPDRPKKKRDTTKVAAGRPTNNSLKTPIGRENPQENEVAPPIEKRSVSSKQSTVLALKMDERAAKDSSVVSYYDVAEGKYSSPIQGTLRAAGAKYNAGSSISDEPVNSKVNRGITEVAAGRPSNNSGKTPIGRVSRKKDEVGAPNEQGSVASEQSTALPVKKVERDAKDSSAVSNYDAAGVKCSLPMQGALKAAAAENMAGPSKYDEPVNSKVNRGITKVAAGRPSNNSGKTPISRESRKKDEVGAPNEQGSVASEQTTAPPVKKVEGDAKHSSAVINYDAAGVKCSLPMQGTLMATAPELNAGLSKYDVLDRCMVKREITQFASAKPSSNFVKTSIGIDSPKKGQVAPPNEQGSILSEHSLFPPVMKVDRDAKDTPVVSNYVSAGVICSSHLQGTLSVDEAEFKSGSRKSDEPDRPKENRGITKVAADRPTNTSIKTPIGRESLQEDEIAPLFEKRSVSSEQSTVLPLKIVERAAKESSVVSCYDVAEGKCSSPIQGTLRAAAAKYNAGSSKSDEPVHSKVNRGITKVAAGRQSNNSGITLISRGSHKKEEVGPPKKLDCIATEQSPPPAKMFERDVKHSSVMNLAAAAEFKAGSRKSDGLDSCTANREIIEFASTRPSNNSGKTLIGRVSRKKDEVGAPNEQGSVASEQSTALPVKKVERDAKDSSAVSNYDAAGVKCSLPMQGALKATAPEFKAGLSKYDVLDRCMVNREITQFASAKPSSKYVKTSIGRESPKKGEVVPPNEQGSILSEHSLFPPVMKVDRDAKDTPIVNNYGSAGLTCSSHLQGTLRVNEAEFKAGSRKSDEPDRPKENRGITKVAAGRPANTSVKTPIGQGSLQEDEVAPLFEKRSVASEQSTVLPLKIVERAAKESSVVSCYDVAEGKCSSPIQGTLRAAAAENMAGPSKYDEPVNSQVNRGFTKVAAGRPSNNSGKTPISRESRKKDEVGAPNEQGSVASEQSTAPPVKKVEGDAKHSSAVINYDAPGVKCSLPMQGTLMATAPELNAGLSKYDVLDRCMVKREITQFASAKPSSNFVKTSIGIDSPKKGQVAPPNEQGSILSEHSLFPPVMKVDRDAKDTPVVSNYVSAGVICSSHLQGTLSVDEAEFKSGSRKSDEPDRPKENRGITKVAADRPTNTSIKTPIGRESLQEDEIAPLFEKRSVSSEQSTVLPLKIVERAAKESSVVSCYDVAEGKCSSPIQGTLRAAAAKYNAGSSKSDEPVHSKVNRGITKVAAGRQSNNSGITLISRGSHKKEEAGPPKKLDCIATEQSPPPAKMFERDVKHSSVMNLAAAAEFKAGSRKSDGLDRCTANREIIEFASTIPSYNSGITLISRGSHKKEEVGPPKKLDCIATEQSPPPAKMFERDVKHSSVMNLAAAAEFKAGSRKSDGLDRCTANREIIEFASTRPSNNSGITLISRGSHKKEEVGPPKKLDCIATEQSPPPAKMFERDVKHSSVMNLAAAAEFKAGSRKSDGLDRCTANREIIEFASTRPSNNSGITLISRGSHKKEEVGPPKKLDCIATEQSPPPAKMFERDVKHSSVMNLAAAAEFKAGSRKSDGLDRCTANREIIEFASTIPSYNSGITLISRGSHKKEEVGPPKKLDCIATEQSPPPAKMFERDVKHSSVMNLAAAAEFKAGSRKSDGLDRCTANREIIEFASTRPSNNSGITLISRGSHKKDEDSPHNEQGNIASEQSTVTALKKFERNANDSSVMSNYDAVGVKCSSPIQGTLRATVAEFKAGSSKSDEPDTSKVNRGITTVAAGRPSNNFVKTPIGRESPKKDDVAPTNEHVKIVSEQSTVPTVMKVEKEVKYSSVVSNYDATGVKYSSFMQGTLRATATEFELGASKSDDLDRYKANRGISEFASIRPSNNSVKSSYGIESHKKDIGVLPYEHGSIADEPSIVSLVKNFEGVANDSSDESKHHSPVKRYPTPTLPTQKFISQDIGRRTSGTDVLDSIGCDIGRGMTESTVDSCLETSFGRERYEKVESPMELRSSECEQDPSGQIKELSGNVTWWKKLPILSAFLPENKHCQGTHVSMGLLSSNNREIIPSPVESTSQAQISFENDAVPEAQVSVDLGLKLIKEPSECLVADMPVVNSSLGVLCCSFQAFRRKFSSRVKNDEIDKSPEFPATYMIEKPLHGWNDPKQEQIPSEGAKNFIQHDIKDGNGEISYVRQLYPEPQEKVESLSSDGTHCVDTMMKMTVVLDSHRSKYTLVRKFYEDVYSRCPLNALMMKFIIGHPNLTFHIDCESETIKKMRENLVDYDGEQVKGSDRRSFADFHKRIIYLGGLVEDKLKVDQVIGLFCSSLCLMSMYLVFKNGGRPYARGDKVKGEEYRKLIGEAVKRRKNGEEMMRSIKWALDRKSMIGREIAVISALAKIFAANGLEKGIAFLRRQLPSLLCFFENQVVATLSSECESRTAALTA